MANETRNAFSSHLTGLEIRELLFADTGFARPSSQLVSPLLNFAVVGRLIHSSMHLQGLSVELARYLG
jgi:hypothetical protein